MNYHVATALACLLPLPSPGAPGNALEKEALLEFLRSLTAAPLIVTMPTLPR